MSIRSDRSYRDAITQRVSDGAAEVATHIKLIKSSHSYFQLSLELGGWLVGDVVDRTTCRVHPKECPLRTFQYLDAL